MTWNSDFKKPAGDDLRALLDAGGVPEIVAYIRGIATPLERRQLFAFAQQTLAKRRDPARNLDALIGVVRAGIDEGMRQAATETAPVDVARRKDFANILSYNLAADLAECWPGDLTPRVKRHFEVGLAAAQDCVRWRDELAKPAAARCLAWWVRGAHELSLGRGTAAAASFERALDFARKSATTAPAAVVPGGDFHVILACGCLGLATKTALFGDACTAFDATAAIPGHESAAAAKSGAAQLRWFAARLADPARPV